MATRPTEIYGLLVPLLGDRLILPRSCVAEVIGYQPPAEMTGAPPWYLGLIAWNGRHLPLVSFEGCCGQDVAAATPRSRLVIVHAVSPHVEAGFLAILSQGFPQLVRLGPEAVHADPDRTFAADAPVICSVNLLGEAALVPDLDRLESLVAAETGPLPPG